MTRGSGHLAEKVLFRLTKNLKAEKVDNLVMRSAANQATSIART